MRVLVLDDDDVRHRTFAKMLDGHEVVAARNYNDAVHALMFTQRFDYAYLDHDLEDYQAGFERTGSDVALFIATLSQNARPQRIVIHSWNSIGARRMARILTEAGHRRVRISQFSENWANG